MGGETRQHQDKHECPTTTRDLIRIYRRMEDKDLELRIWTLLQMKKLFQEEGLLYEL